MQYTKGCEGNCLRTPYSFVRGTPSVLEPSTAPEKSMTKLCLNCGRSNHARAVHCKKCNAPLGHALRIDPSHTARRTLILLGVVGILLLVLVLLNTFAVIRLY
jgi:ribosomal protein L40E